MAEKKKKKANKKKAGKESKKFDFAVFKERRVMVPGVTFLALLVLYTGAFGFLNLAFAKKIMPGVKISGIEVGGMTKEEAVKTLDSKTSEILQKGSVIKEGEHSFTISTEEIGLEYRTKETVERAADLNKLNFNLFDLLKRDLSLEYKIDEKKLDGVLERELAKINTAAVESKVRIEKGKIVFTDDKEGEGVDKEKAKGEVKVELQEIKSEILVTREILKPKVTKNDLEKNREEIEDFLKESLVLTSEGKIFEVETKTLAEWIDIEKWSKVSITLNREKIKGRLEELAKKINRGSVNAALKIEGGKATVFSLSRDGKGLKVDQSTEKIAKEAKKSKKIELVVETAKADVNEGNMEKLGIRELVATGFSDFKGSPANRIHNIKIGASKFNGVLIKPDEDFSFNKALGPVEAYTGFLPELVILQNKTVPQYGGGLCQVSSTAFRAALDSGLPITARTAHAYPVQYYKPYGVDATIYLPNPDLKFKNDTGNYILIQTRVEGTKLYFDFYGTKKKETLKFAGNAEGTGGVPIAEQVSASIFNQGNKGNGSFDAIFYRLTYDANGSLIKRDKFFSSYDSPDKYPH